MASSLARTRKLAGSHRFFEARTNPQPAPWLASLNFGAGVGGMYFLRRSGSGQSGSGSERPRQSGRRSGRTPPPPPPAAAFCDKKRRGVNPTQQFHILNLNLFLLFCGELGGRLAGGLGLIGEVLADFDSLADLAAAEEEEEDPWQRTRGGNPERVRAGGGGDPQWQSGRSGSGRRRPRRPRRSGRRSGRRRRSGRPHL